MRSCECDAIFTTNPWFGLFGWKGVPGWILWFVLGDISKLSICQTITFDNPMQARKSKSRNKIKHGKKSVSDCCVSLVPNSIDRENEDILKTAR